MTNVKKYQEYIGKYKLPPSIGIATMTVHCKFDVEFMVHNIGQYIELHKDRVVAITYGNSKKYTRSVIEYKKKKDKIGQRRQVFMHQCTALIRPAPDKPYINVKIFTNGSLQLTGCKGYEDVLCVLEILCIELRKRKHTYANNKITFRPFVERIENLSIDMLCDFKICMINAIYYSNIKLNLYKLLDVVRNNGNQVKFDKENHAAVNITIKHNDHDITILVFQSGNVLITGGVSYEHVLAGYKFIVSLFYNNYNTIVSKDYSTDLC